MTEGMSVRLRDVTAGEQQSALSRACWVIIGESSALMSAAATDKHLQSDRALLLQPTLQGIRGKSV